MKNGELLKKFGKKFLVWGWSHITNDAFSKHVLGSARWFFEEYMGKENNWEFQKTKDSVQELYWGVMRDYFKSGLLLVSKRGDICGYEDTWNEERRVYEYDKKRLRHISLGYTVDFVNYVAWQQIAPKTDFNDGMGTVGKVTFGGKKRGNKEGIE